MGKVELLAPAGNLGKAKIALMYGADAVYVGGKQFSLRARASNFSITEIEELVKFAHTRNKKVYVTMNIIPHDSDLNNLETYLKDLERIKVDAIIVSSLYIIRKAKELVPNLEVHLSTQKSTTNVKTINYYQNKGVSRVVLAREVTLDEMKYISQNTDVELEVFIHGGMCSSYSGHCVLSNYMTNRDANRGGCAHSCRWNYSLVKNGEILPENYNIGSKDMMAARYIPQLIDMNVASLKIEGRMKSAYYLACVVRSYRMLIDEYYEKGKITDEFFAFIIDEIKKAENRETSVGFYDGIPGVCGQLYDNRTEIPTQEYVAFVLEYNKDKQMALVEQRNYLTVNDEIEVFGPNLKSQFIKVEQMLDFETNQSLEVARHPLQKFWINMPFEVTYGDLIRLIKNK
ncbi:MAG: U32 family peptidase [Bacilli bacterium]|nr:U32 family peptidase [Bacilli bacterium]